MATLSRRAFVRAATSLGVSSSCLGVAIERILAGSELATFDIRAENIPFLDETKARRPREQRRGHGLDGRFRLDLSGLDKESMVIDRDRFYIRTRVPDSLDTSKPWTIGVRGLIEHETNLALDDLMPSVEDQGVYLLECSGNGIGGLISAAEWKGIPIERVFEEIDTHAKPNSDATQILFIGFDEHSGFERRRRELGCSWVYTRERLLEAGAFLATHLGGERIDADHGYPVRLMVPGWYGCCCPKWLSEIRFIDNDFESTPHMREFASRTLQQNAHRLARSFQPALIDLSAMPVRVEKHTGDRGEHYYRVVGIIWGGQKTTTELDIRFGGSDAKWHRVDQLKHETNRTWSLWSHTWQPEAPGSYAIDLRIDDPTIHARKLNKGIFRRVVDIKDV